MAEFLKVASTNEIASGQARLMNIKSKEIALFNIEGTFFAFENACTHEEGPLAEGEIEGHDVTCPWHDARFTFARERSSVRPHMKTLPAITCA
jgi:3-phenylpropionate/trans-cinnamate dioxygenase ferredoxin component